PFVIGLFPVGPIGPAMSQEIKSHDQTSNNIRQGHNVTLFKLAFVSLVLFGWGSFLRFAISVCTCAGRFATGERRREKRFGCVLTRSLRAARPTFSRCRRRGQRNRQ